MIPTEPPCATFPEIVRFRRLPEETPVDHTMSFAMVDSGCPHPAEMRWIQTDPKPARAYPGAIKDDAVLYPLWVEEGAVRAYSKDRLIRGWHELPEFVEYRTCIAPPGAWLAVFDGKIDVPGAQKKGFTRMEGLEAFRVNDFVQFHVLWKDWRSNAVAVEKPGRPMLALLRDHNESIAWELARSATFRYVVWEEGGRIDLADGGRITAQEAFERLPPSFVLHHEYDYSEDKWGAMWFASPEVPDTKIVAEGADFVVRRSVGANAE